MVSQVVPFPFSGLTPVASEYIQRSKAAQRELSYTAMEGFIAARTIIAGAIWGQQAWGTYWSWDPKEVWTFVIWTIYAAYLHARATKNTPRRTANWIAIAGFVCIIINYTVVNFYFIGMHSYAL